MVFYYVLKHGLLRRADIEKIRFFFGATADELFLSRRWPLITAIDWPRALLSPSYAGALVAWLKYRAELYEGGSG